MTLPDFIDKTIWSEYKKMRTKIKKPMTPYAEQLAVNKLTRLKDQGEDPNLVLEQSIEKSWQGLFAVKDKPIQEPPSKPTSWQFHNEPKPKLDMEMVEESVKLFHDVRGKRISEEELRARCTMMHECWPNAGWNERVEEFVELLRGE